MWNDLNNYVIKIIDIKIKVTISFKIIFNLPRREKKNFALYMNFFLFFVTKSVVKGQYFYFYFSYIELKYFFLTFNVT